jgi:hypothetical protein
MHAEERKRVGAAICSDERPVSDFWACNFRLLRKQEQ